MSTEGRNPSMDPRLADDRDITYWVDMTDGKTHRWTGTSELVNQVSAKARSGPMLLVADDNELLNFAHVIRMKPMPGQLP